MSDQTHGLDGVTKSMEVRKKGSAVGSEVSFCQGDRRRGQDGEIKDTSDEVESERGAGNEKHIFLFVGPS